MSEPLISVMMPCYNAASTLPIALASLLTQTYQNWECIFVDDGSTDHSSAIVAQVADPRIRSFTLPHNYGRATARQVALDQARGAYLCILDADDWYYPCKLEQQLAIMEAEKRIVLVSTAVASVDRKGEIVGVYRHPAAKSFPTLQKFDPRLGRIPVSFNAAMIRMAVAQQAQFASQLRQAEDADWLLKVLWDREYAVLPAVTYVYNEYVTTTQHKTISAYYYQMVMYWLNRHRSWPRACGYMVQMGLKQTLYRLAFRLGFADRLIAWRSQKPSAADIQAFYAARRPVHRRLAQLHDAAYTVSPGNERLVPAVRAFGEFVN